jgi:WD40 repeat protein
VRAIGGFGGPIFKLQFTPDGKQLIACSSDKTIRVFDPAKGEALRTLQGHNDWVYTFAITPDGKSLASGSWDGEVRLWNLADGKLDKTIIAAPGFKPASGAQASTK